jgi:hypothetical protein
MIRQASNSSATAKFILVTALLLASACYAYSHFQGIQCEPYLPKGYCPPCPSENKKYAVLAFLIAEFVAFALFISKRKTLLRNQVSKTLEK